MSPILIILTYLWYLNIKNEKEYKVKCRIISAVKGGHVDIQTINYEMLKIIDKVPLKIARLFCENIVT